MVIVVAVVVVVVVDVAWEIAERGVVVGGWSDLGSGSSEHFSPIPALEHKG